MQAKVAAVPLLGVLNPHMQAVVWWVAAVVSEVKLVVAKADQLADDAVASSYAALCGMGWGGAWGRDCTSCLIVD